MSTMASWRRRRQIIRTERAIARAINSAPSPAMREELFSLANRGDQRFR